MLNYYLILKIQPTASKKEIKEAFKKEALKWHPDRNDSSDATKKMQLINEAYLILKDDDARARYNKEYYKFQETHREKQDNHQEETRWHDYSSNDDILNDWIKKAKKQAKEMVMMSFEDLVGISRTVGNEVLNEMKFVIVLVLIGIIIIYVA